MDHSPRRPFGEWAYDYASQRWSWSDDMYDVVGFSPDGDDPVDRLFARMHPDDRRLVDDLLSVTLPVAGPLSGQYRVRDEGGRERVVAFVGNGEHDGDGAPVRLRGFAFDVTPVAQRVTNDAVAAATADRAAIEQVKGALMFAYGIDADAAFDILSRYSQRRNVRVAVLAQRVAHELSSGCVGGSAVSMLQLLDAAVAAGPDTPGGRRSPTVHPTAPH
ncbi:hypothetical protein GCM10023168_37740 [Fodinibacter luteus]|uniref:ANTAR domain-containing protein n=1 Tax=Fodinibacter luteus TaxID=552064 RepID=A0ABP8KRG5_9MICO